MYQIKRIERCELFTIICNYLQTHVDFHNLNEGRSNKMIETIRVRLEPNNKQLTKLFQYANCTRFAYN